MLMLFQKGEVFMELQEFQSLFDELIEKNGLPPLSADKKESFWAFTLHLLRINEHINLTAIRNVPDVIAKHYADSLFAAAYLPEGARVLDLGCGPGFPSLPLAIARPDLRIVALDSTDKKVRFLFDSACLLHLSNVEAVSGRAEDPVIRKRLGEFDAVVSRAVARLNVLSELCLPYVRIGGRFLAMKGAKGEEELREASRAIDLLGGALERVDEKALVLPDGTSEPRLLLDIRKVKKTPADYPRAYAAILKKPL